MWDLEELFSYKAEKPVFTLKPGYKAMEKHTKTGSTNYKKVIYYRGEPREIYAYKAPNCLTVVTMLSHSQSHLYIKSFFLNKFSILIDRRKLYEQVPTKLIRELQAIAHRRRRLPPENQAQTGYTHE